METLATIKHRISANAFDTSFKLSDAEINELATLASEAPTSYNVQNYRFVAVSTPEAKEALKAASYGQQKIADASVAFVIFGDLKPVDNGIAAWKILLDSGNLPQGTFDYMKGAITQAYSDEQNSKNEAYRSAGLAGMTLMLAAEAKGLVSCPMGGFVPDQVNAALNVPARYFPAMIVVVGKALPEGNFPRKPRLGLDIVLAHNTGESFPA
jgi:nitroreductase